MADVASREDELALVALFCVQLLLDRVIRLYSSSSKRSRMHETRVVPIQHHQNEQNRCRRKNALHITEPRSVREEVFYEVGHPLGTIRGCKQYAVHNGTLVAFARSDTRIPACLTLSLHGSRADIGAGLAQDISMSCYVWKKRATV